MKLKHRIVAGLLAGILHGVVYYFLLAQESDTNYTKTAVAQGLVLGLAVGLVLPLLAKTLNKRKKTIEVELYKDEELALEGVAQYQTGDSLVIGKLFLSNFRLFFIPTIPTSQLEELSFDREGIGNFELTETPKGIALTTEELGKVTFLMQSPEEWLNTLK